MGGKAGGHAIEAPGRAGAKRTSRNGLSFAFILPLEMRNGLVTATAQIFALFLNSGDTVNRSKKDTDVTTAMLRAFVSMSRTLNLTKTCHELGATRQTVRRHLNDLEHIRGETLFEIVDRQYSITERGQAALPGAMSLLQDLDGWSGQAALKRRRVGGLEASSYVDADGLEFLSQQHPVSTIAIDGLPLAREALRAWGAAAGQIEHDEMANLRRHIVLYRKGADGWIFVDVGSESAYAKWFGWTWSRSAIGKLLDEDNVGDEFNEFIAGAYSRIYEEGGVRLDHLYAHLPKDGGDPQPVTFQRLLLGCQFPDATPGLVVLALITRKVDIEALPISEMPEIPAQLIMDEALAS